jgi:hypothetical protein
MACAPARGRLPAWVGHRGPSPHDMAAEPTPRSLRANAGAPGVLERPRAADPAPSSGPCPTNDRWERTMSAVVGGKLDRERLVTRSSPFPFVASEGAPQNEGATDVAGSAWHSRSARLQCLGPSGSPCAYGMIGR